MGVFEIRLKYEPEVRFSSEVENLWHPWILIDFFPISMVNNMKKLHANDQLFSKVPTHTWGTSKWLKFKSELSDFVMRIPAYETFPNYCFDKMNRFEKIFTDIIFIFSRNWFICHCSVQTINLMKATICEKFRLRDSYDEINNMKHCRTNKIQP